RARARWRAVPDRDAGGAPRATDRSGARPRDIVVRPAQHGVPAPERAPARRRQAGGGAVPAARAQVVGLHGEGERPDHAERAHQRGEEGDGQGDGPFGVEVVPALPEREEARGVERRQGFFFKQKTAYEILNPSRWQPSFVTRGTGLFSIQQFVTP